MLEEGGFTNRCVHVGRVAIMPQDLRLAQREYTQCATATSAD